MKLQLECLPCYIRQALEAARMVTDDRKLQEKILREALVAASKFETNEIGILTQAKIQKIIKKLSPKIDPYKKAKQMFNKICLNISEELEEKIKKSKNQFETSLRIALAGNIIDFGQGININKKIIKKAIEESFSQQLDEQKIKLLKYNIKDAKKILFIGDNAGEIVFDKLFLKHLPKNKITYVVRGGPALNDATMEDAEMVSMTDIVRVITTGLNMTAAILPLCSKNFLKEYSNSDFIIAKGQGNYEALSDENKNIFFLLKIKCEVIARNFNGRYKVGDIVVSQ